MSMKIPYEILLRGNPDGTFSGGHVIFVAGEPAKALGTDAHSWPEALGQVNEALAQQAALVGEVKSQLQAMTEERNKAVTALANIDPEIKRKAIQDQKDALAAESAKLDQQLAGL